MIDINFNPDFINKKVQEEVRFPEIVQEINVMAQLDQDVRKRQIEEPGFWKENLDEEHTKKMKEIVGRIGWPTISKVGIDACHSAWILVQHADHDVAFQENCLNLMKKEPAGEISLHDLAYLEDRARSNTGRSLLYATQFQFVNGAFTPKETEEPEKVNERRKAMGLQTLAENIDEMYEKYKVEKPRSSL